MTSAPVTSVNPQQQEALDRIYTYVLSRTYRHHQTGTLVMLSIAYGSEQSKQAQVHRPEVCYPAQGFQVLRSEEDIITTSSRSIPVRRLVTRQGMRTEPLTYWIRIGDRIARSWFDQKVAVVLEGLAGKVSDGVIFRVSTISNDIPAAFSVQSAFIAELIENLQPSDAPMFIGRINELRL